MTKRFIRRTEGGGKRHFGMNYGAGRETPDGVKKFPPTGHGGDVVEEASVGAAFDGRVKRDGEVRAVGRENVFEILVRRFAGGREVKALFDGVVKCLEACREFRFPKGRPRGFKRVRLNVGLDLDLRCRLEERRNGAVGRLVLDTFSLTANSTRADVFEAVARAKAEGLTPREAIAAVAATRVAPERGF